VELDAMINRAGLENPAYANRAETVNRILGHVAACPYKADYGRKSGSVGVTSRARHASPLQVTYPNFNEWLRIQISLNPSLIKRDLT
jgi:hypothetical protein